MTSSDYNLHSIIPITETYSTLKSETDQSITEDDDVSPEKLYASAVESCYRQPKTCTLYPGENYKYLAVFLNRPYARFSRHYNPAPDLSSAASSFRHVFVHRYQNNRPKDALRKPLFFDCASGLGEFQGLVPQSGDIIFIQGHTSPQWLNMLGAKYVVDAEFFRRHLHCIQEPLYFDLPSLRSNSIHMVTIPLISIGTWDNSAFSSLDLNDLNDARMRASKGNISSLRNQSNSVVGTSVIREYLLLTSRHFAVQQQLSVHVHERKDGSWAASIWSDCGRGLSAMDDNLWWDPCNNRNISRVNILPVFQYQRKLFVNHIQRCAPEQNKTYTSELGNTFQSASLLADQYGQGLNGNIVREDALYALSELFTFSAFSESQFLNLMSYVLDEQMSQPSSLFSTTLSNLSYYKRILDSHTDRLKVMMYCLDARGGPTWPRTKDIQHRKIADTTITALKGDFEELAHRATSLSKKCSDESTTLMNRVIVEDTKRGYVQNQNTASLTLLASYFLPISLIASMFGMSFKELQDADGPRLSIWVWFVVAVPVLIASQFIYTFMRK